jgi:RND superfamily putative drug exporter
MFHQLGWFAASRPWVICVLWVLLGLGLARVAPHWDTRTQDDDVRFVPDRFTSVRAYQILEKAFPKDVSACRLIFAVEREDGTLTDADLALVDGLVQDLDKLRSEAPELKLGKVESYKEGFLGNRLTSTDQQCTLIGVPLETPFLALGTVTSVDRCQAVAKEHMVRAGPNAPKLFTTGAAGIGRDLTKACGDSLEGTTVATVILVIVVLLFVYRAPLLALIPLVSIAVSVWVALNALALMTMIPGVHLVNISKIFAIVILYGAGTDYCLFLVSRYREELELGRDGPSAIAASVGAVGHALAASAGTVMVGLGLMGLAEFAKVRYAGPAIALSLGVALIASLTLTPALLRILGNLAFWPLKPPRAAPPALLRRIRVERLGFWDVISHGVARHPVMVWLAAVVILLPLVIIGAKVEPNYRATGELSPCADSLQGLAAIQRHFTAGEIGPITVLLVSDDNWDSREGRMEIDHLSRGFAGLANVAEVRSLTQPLGAPLPDLRPNPDGSGLVHRLLVHFEPYLRSFGEAITLKAREHYVSCFEEEPAAPAAANAAFHETAPPQEPITKHVTRLDIVLKSDPFDAVSHTTLKLIQTWLNTERPRTTFLESAVQAECAGITANAQDLAEVTESDRHRVNTLVLAAIFLILLWLVGKLWLAAYLLVTVLLSYYAALGATVLAAFFWSGHILIALDWRVPFFLFTILVAVGEDYNILLVHRALEEAKRHGPVEGMRRALARTGGAITSCGLIMAGTFATLMLAGLGTLLQIGFALAFGVLIDTFVVRPFLVPAFAILCWRQAEPRQSATKASRAQNDSLVLVSERAA